MGSLMTQCMGMLHWDLFAAIAPFSGFLFDEYWHGPETSLTQPYALTRKREEKLRAEAGRSAVLPLIQFTGTADRTWTEELAIATRAFWSKWNEVPEFDLSGQPMLTWGDDGRFDIFDSKESVEENLYRFVNVKDLTHAVDLREPYLAWDFISRFSRDERSGNIKFE